MPTRNFDSSIIAKRLQNQVYARNLYINNTNGRQIINNPQNSNGNASKFNLYIPGAQTEYYRGLIGAGETISIGGIVNIPPFPQSSNIITSDVYSWKNINNTTGYTSAVSSSNLDTILLSSGFNTDLLSTNNKGANWTTISTGINNFIYGFTGSADTTKLAIARGSGYIYTSSNSGLSWIERTTSGIRNWQDITSSADGNKLIAVGTNLRIYISNNSGSTWTEQLNSVQTNYSEVACSSNGNIIVACVGSKSLFNQSGYIYKSSDGGINWTALTAAGVRNWGSIDISNDGNIIIAGTNGNNVYISLDGGNTWTAQTSLGLANWITVSVSLDGTKFGAGKEFFGETLFLSFNQGLSWNGQSIVPDSSIDAIKFSQDGLSVLVQSLTGGCWLYSID
jgi:photosystem II stability/assembly factor-like uncharacterized protein